MKLIKNKDNNKSRTQGGKFNENSDFNLMEVRVFSVEY